MKNPISSRKLRLESLEERTLLAVTAGCLETATAMPGITEGEGSLIVDTLEDKIDDKDGVNSLREALKNASDDDTITFADNLRGGTISLDSGSDMLISKGVTIDASSIGGITIAQQSKRKYSGYFGVSYGVDKTVVLKNLTLTNFGTGIINSSSKANVTVIDCIITDNKHGIENHGGTMTVTNCTISGNVDTSYEGSGAGIENAGEMEVSECIITKNSGKNGGGIFNSGTIEIKKTLISENTASNGAGVYNVPRGVFVTDPTTGSMSITDCIIQKNVATANEDNGGGGGVENRGGWMTIKNTLITENKGHWGGGVFAWKATHIDGNLDNNLTVINCRIQNNEADYGGGLLNKGTVNLWNCEISGNKAEKGAGGGEEGGYGGGIYTFEILTMTNCTIAGNNAEYGGGIFTRMDNNNHDYLTIRNSIIAENYAQSQENGDDIFHYLSRGLINAYNTLSSFENWSTQQNCIKYDSSKPLFSGDGYTLAANSQAINTGNNIFIYQAPDPASMVDLAGVARIVDSMVDIGAYEYQGHSGGGDDGNETADIIDRIEVASLNPSYYAQGRKSQPTAGEAVQLSLYLKDGYGPNSDYRVKQADWRISSVEGGVIDTDVWERTGEIYNQNGSVTQLVFTPEKGAHGKKYIVCTVILEQNGTGKELTDEISGEFEVFFLKEGNDGVEGQDSNEDNWLYYWANDGAITGLTLDGTGVIHYGDCTVISKLLKPNDEQAFAHRSGTKIGISQRALSGNGVLTPDHWWNAVTTVWPSSFSVYKEVTSWGLPAKNIKAVSQFLAHEYQHYVTEMEWIEWKKTQQTVGSEYNEYYVKLSDRKFMALIGGYDLGTEVEALVIKAYANFTNLENISELEKYADKQDTLTCLTDTMCLAEFVHPTYWYMGDNELQSRRAEQSGLKRVNPDKDWSLGGIISSKTDDVQVISADVVPNMGGQAEPSEQSVIQQYDLPNGDGSSSPSQENRITKSSYSPTSVAEDFISVFAENSIDSNADGYYDNLTITLDVGVLKNGTYEITWDIFDSENNYIDTYSEEVELESGTTELFLDISGAKLSCAVDGVLSVSLYLFSYDDNVVEFVEHTTQPYNYSQFSPYVLLSNFTTTTSDANNNGFYDTLTVDFDAELTENSAYLCSVNLTDADGNVIDTVTISDIQGKGIHNLSATFNGLKIHKSKVNGPYKIDLSFHNVISYLSEFNGENVYQTPSYSYNDFEGAQASFSGTFAENAVDTDGDGRHNTLTISVGVNVAVAGNYSVTGYLKDEAGNSIDYDVQTVSLAVGNNTVDLTFDNERIFAAQKNGPYVLSSLILSDATYGTIENLSNAYTTQVYDYTSHDPLDKPVILTGKGGYYVSYGANRHLITWGTVENAASYELEYSENRTDWVSVSTQDTNIVVYNLNYGADMTYRVRALGTDSDTISEWSVSKTFNVCPMDINNDGDISGGDRTLLSNAWLAEEGDGEFPYYCDINGDGDISNADRTYLSNNWLGETGDDYLVYPPPRPFYQDAPELDVSNGGTVQLADGVISLTTGTIMNNGNVTAKAGYKIKVYASSDTAITSNDIPLGTYAVETPLLSKQSTTLSYSNISTALLAAGQSYYIGWVISDVDGETKTNNNTAYCTTMITIPPLVPDIEASNGGTVQLSNGTISLTTGTITNVGTGTVSPSYRISVYASDDATITAADTLLGSYIRKAVLAPDDSTAFDYSYISTSSLTAGQSYYIGWIISDVEGETETNNNTAYCTTEITIPVLVPDIEASNGGTVQLSNGTISLTTGTITNIGTGTVIPNYKVSIYASADTTITTSDTLIASYTRKAIMAPGYSTTFDYSDISTSSLTAGQSYYIGWIISDVEGETETDNNTAYCPTKITIPISVADLAADNGGSISVSDGKFTLVTGPITNVGTGTAAAGYKINVYASTDATIDTADTLLTTYTAGSDLAASQSTPQTISNISTGMLTVGAKYYIGWIITDVSGETNVTNNTACCASQLTVTGTPNLKASNGGSYTVRYDDVKAIIELTTGTFTNRGTGRLEAETYQISVYASSDTSIDNTDRLLRTRYINEAFNSGESKTLHFDAIGLTNVIVGNTYYIGWIVTDASGKEITKGYCPTQMIAPGVTDLNAANGGTFSLSGKKISLTTGNIKNLGTQKASSGSYSIRVFLSKNTTISPDEDIRIAIFNDTPSILYGETKTVTISNIDLSAFSQDTLPAGTYYIGWIIRGVDGETRTNNNAAYCTQNRVRVKSDRSIVTYPLPSNAAVFIDSVFAEYESADLSIDFDIF